MSPEVSERSFEEAIECGLLQNGPDACAGDTTGLREPQALPYGDAPPGGYRKRRPEDYDRALCLLPRDAIDFILATQPKEWQKLAQHHGAAVTLEFKSTLRWSLKEDRQDDKGVTHASLKTIAAFLNTEGGDLLIGVADDGSIVGIERDQLENDDKFMRHLAQIVRNGLGDRAGTCIDPKTQIVEEKTVCVVSCQRSPEPVFLKWKGLETSTNGDFFVRSGPGTVKLPPDSASEYVRTRFPSTAGAAAPPPKAME
jgi:hypothetical protein